ncbi:DUF423 domain-containing protein [Paenibacillus albicereus]|uniref:DUF423 domain-containing protein n=1 Tax=Paenibacillus albicereus TaxID=2726185 RepID=A0A6H2GY54_9BACL|nr:DUF423 domain-containing protein [Paenibacillus albicereus]QJC52106.1 DUF423 domain-containing protein [Paenibacillus albicereus]
MQTAFVLGAAFLFLGVAVGAFGAHALKARLAGDAGKNYQTGVLYHLLHGVGIVAVGATPLAATSSLLQAAVWLFAAGIVLFSGSLYALSLSGVKKLGAITPLGGLAFLAGWALVAIAYIG